MMAKKEEIGNNRFVKAEHETKRDPAVEKSIQNLLNGSFLTRRKVLSFLPFLFFLALIGILYIANVYYSEKKIREINSLRKELKELRYEYITEKSRLMYRSKQSEVAKELEGSGIKELQSPPSKVVIPSEKEGKK